MRHTPEAPDGQARRITFALIALGIAIFMLSPVFPDGRAFFQAVSFVLLALGIFISVRFVMTSFSYSIEPKNRAQDDDGTVTAADVGSFHVRHLPPSSLDLVVRKSQGQRIGIIEARLALSDLTYFAPLPREGGQKREPYRRYPAMRVYNYTVSIRPVVQYIAVFVDEAGVAIGVLLETDDAMAQYLADTAAKNTMDS